MSNKIGVFICHCGINIASSVDIKALREYAKTLDNVVVSKDYKYMCSDVGANLIKDSIKKYKLDSVVIASCSPRMHEHTFRAVVEEGGINGFNLEIANIREQCSWAHEDMDRASEKAKAASCSLPERDSAHFLDLDETSSSGAPPPATTLGFSRMSRTTHNASWIERSASSATFSVPPLIKIVTAFGFLQPSMKTHLSSPTFRSSTSSA